MVILDKINDLVEQHKSRNPQCTSPRTVVLSAPEMDLLAIELAEKLAFRRGKAARRLRLAAENHIACALISGCTVNGCVVYLKPDAAIIAG